MPPPGLRKILEKATFDQYPDSQATGLRERLSSELGMGMESILAGSGTTELIRLVALAYFGPGDRVLILGPTFGEYEIACRIMGAEPVGYRAPAESDFAPSIPKVEGIIQRLKPKAVFICNPNNPAGNFLPRRDIEAILRSMSEGLLVLDEAYVSFVARHWNSIDLIEKGNVIILRSMTKDFGLAGLRLGYAVSRPEIIGNLRRVCPPWNVNTVALKAGATALDNLDFLIWSQQQLRELKRYLVKNIRRLDLDVLPSKAHFFLIRVGKAKEFRQALLKYGILVRDCTSFGLPEYVRVAPRTMPECRELVRAISELKY